jgi:hypothetical protein
MPEIIENRINVRVGTHWETERNEPPMEGVDACSEK